MLGVAWSGLVPKQCHWGPANACQWKSGHGSASVVPQAFKNTTLWCPSTVLRMRKASRLKVGPTWRLWISGICPSLPRDSFMCTILHNNFGCWNRLKMAKWCQMVEHGWTKPDRPLLGVTVPQCGCNKPVWFLLMIYLSNLYVGLGILYAS